MIVMLIKMTTIILMMLIMMMLIVMMLINHDSPYDADHVYDDGPYDGGGCDLPFNHVDHVDHYDPMMLDYDDLIVILIMMMMMIIQMSSNRKRKSRVQDRCRFSAEVLSLF